MAVLALLRASSTPAFASAVPSRTRPIRGSAQRRRPRRL